MDQDYNHNVYIFKSFKLTVVLVFERLTRNGSEQGLRGVTASLVMPISDPRDRFFYPYYTPMKDTYFSPTGQEYHFLPVSEIFPSRPAISA